MIFGEYFTYKVSKPRLQLNYAVGGYYSLIPERTAHRANAYILPKADAIHLDGKGFYCFTFLNYGNYISIMKTAST